MRKGKQMSHEMFVGETKFHISRANEEAARLTLVKVAKEIVEKDDICAGDIRTMVEGRACEIEQLTLDDLVQCWFWYLIRDIANETDEIIDIAYSEDYSGDEETLFEALAPYVTAGSYITLSGEGTGGTWAKRYGFTGRRLVELEAEYPPVPIESDEPGSTGESPEEESGDFSTICPYCNYDGITVIEVTIVSDGLVLNPMVPLERDGFAFETTDDRKDTSTQDEVVRCNNCGCEFGLDELM
jgi:hypothetical protein